MSASDEGHGGGSAVGTAAHRSIGEVLTLLKDDFPDITISKIRFLESQGLLDPERTASGYRRFYDRDVERLRWILRQQREHFLPLKVIKGRLAEAGDSAELPPDLPPPAVAAVEAPTVTNGPPAAAPTVMAATPALPDVPAPVALGRVLPEPALFSHRGIGPGPISGGPLATGSSVSLTADELAAATGLSVADIVDLERFGLVEHRELGSTNVYDDEALLVARLAAVFANHGVEPRHLRMYKVAADREAGMLEQVVLPIARHRAPDARRRVGDTLDELGRLGEMLHAAMLRRALRHVT